jgi:hypothetical protein
VLLDSDDFSIGFRRFGLLWMWRNFPRAIAASLCEARGE